MADFEIVPSDAACDRLDRYVGLFRAAFPDSPKLTREYLKWLYADNPVGAVIGVDAYANGELAAHYALVPVEVELKGKTFLACWSLNTATHPRFQGRGLFLKLAEEAYRIAAARGCMSVIGVANKNSTPGFLRRLGFQHLGQLAVSVGYAALDYRDDERVLARAWSSRSIEWRLKNPWRRYFVSKADGKCSIFTTIGPWSMPVFLCRLNEDKISGLTMASLPLFSRMQPRLLLGFQLVKRGLSVPLPKALWPSPWNVIYRPLIRGAPDNVKLAMVALDLDTF